MFLTFDSFIRSTDDKHLFSVFLTCLTQKLKFEKRIVSIFNHSINHILSRKKFWVSFWFIRTLSVHNIWRFFFRLNFWHGILRCRYTHLSVETLLSSVPNDTMYVFFRSFWIAKIFIELSTSIMIDSVMCRNDSFADIYLRKHIKSHVSITQISYALSLYDDEYYSVIWS